MKKLIFLFTYTFLLQSCSYRHTKEGDTGFSEISGESAMTQAVSYSQLENKIIGPKCLRCHSDSGGNQGGLNMESYDQVRANLESIKQRVFVDQNMPPKSPLNNGEKAIFNNWIVNELATNGKNPTTIKVGIKWPRIRDEIIQTHCIQCHSPPVPDATEDNMSTMEAGLDLTNIAVVREKANLILNRVIVLNNMPLEPLPRLNDQEKKLLVQWMIDGMQDVEPAPVDVPEEKNP